jgi:hypothetical protein
MLYLFPKVVQVWHLEDQKEVPEIELILRPHQLHLPIQQQMQQASEKLQRLNLAFI